MSEPTLTLTTEDYREIDFSLRRTAEDWFDHGEASAMFKFGRSKEVRVDRLLKEARATLAQCVTDKELPRLQALVDFAQAEVTRRKSELALETAVRAARAAGVESWRVGWIVDNVRDAV